MTPITDDMIRSSILDLDDQPDGCVDRAREDVRRRIVRRRRRSVLGVSVLAFGVGALLLLLRDEPQVVATGAAPGVEGSETPDTTAEGLVDSLPSLNLEWVEADGGPDGTERVVLEFDKDLPEVPVVFVDDVGSAEASAVSYTIQGAGGDGITVCGATRWFSFGTIASVLLPSQWFAPGSEAYRSQEPLRFDPARPPQGKIYTCRSEGLIQLVIWGAASDAAADVTVSVEGKTLTIEIVPQ